MTGRGDAGSGRRDPERGRVRFDRPRQGGADTSNGEAGGGSSISGRRFVTAAVVAVLVLWGSLGLAFRHWRDGYRARQAYGERIVVAAIEPLAEVTPAGVDPAAWRNAVVATRAMLKTVTDSNVLDLDRMRALGSRVDARVRSSRPENARAQLAAIWDDAESGAGPIVTSRHPRPPLLRPPPHR